MSQDEKPIMPLMRAISRLREQREALATIRREQAVQDELREQIEEEEDEETTEE